MREIETMPDWPRSLKKFIKMSNSCEISKFELQLLITKKVEEVLGFLEPGLLVPFEQSWQNDGKNRPWDRMEKKVIVEILDLRWFYSQRQNFIGFSTILSKLQWNFYATSFPTLLLDKFWAPAKKEMIWKQFVPYVCLVIFAVNYFHHILSPEELKHAAD